MNEEHRRLIRRIHESPMMSVIVVAGGGSLALAELCAVPGASRTILEAAIPYCEKALSDFLGAAPEQAVSVATAAGLARVAHERAAQLRETESAPTMGVSCTATLATDRPKKGAHRMHVAVCSDGPVKVYSLTFKKSARSRDAEEKLAADLVLRAMAEACGLSFALESELLPEEEVLLTEAENP